jgi:hypothetical protein
MTFSHDKIIEEVTQTEAEMVKENVGENIFE